MDHVFSRGHATKQKSPRDISRGVGREARAADRVSVPRVVFSFGMVEPFHITHITGVVHSELQGYQQDEERLHRVQSVLVWIHDADCKRHVGFVVVSWHKFA